MDGERQKLTKSVSRTNNVVKMLKKQLAKEAKEEKSANRGRRHGGHPDRGNGVVQDINWPPGLTQETSFSNDTEPQMPVSRRRGTRQFLESTELSHTVDSQAAGDRRQGRSHGRSDSGHTDQYKREGQSSSRASLSNTLTDSHKRHYGATEHSDTEGQPTTRTQTDNRRMSQIGQATGSVTISDVRQRDEPWTVDDNTHFVYGPSFRAGDRQTQTQSRTLTEWWNDMWSPYGGFHRLTSVWIYVALALLLVSNCLYIPAFVTNNWGILHMSEHEGVQETKPQQASERHEMAPMISTNNNDTGTMLQWVKDTWDRLTDDKDNVADVKRSAEFSEAINDHTNQHNDDRANGPKTHIKEGPHKRQLNVRDAEPVIYWRFGLWQCCRSSDRLCLGIRWAAFYSAIRTFSVLSLFSMILSFAWMLGHTLEKLLDYDICTMSCLISLCYATSLFTSITVILFGIKWPTEFRNEFDGTDPRLSFSFYLATFTVPLTLSAAICITIDLKTEVKKMKERNSEYYTDTELDYIEDITDIPTDNISRPRRQKKKRRGPVTGGRYAAAAYPT